jgi:glutaredoxin
MIGARSFAAALPAAALAAALLSFAWPTQAQQLYRWTDDQGRTHVTDTPPPPSAKGVQKPKSAVGAAAQPQMPYELAAAQRDFPVVLYTSPPCKAACDQARSALNQRGVPFKEVLVYDEESHEQLKKVAGGSEEVPVLTVGRSVQKGFSQESYDALLDSARYPRAGMLPARSQPAPKTPDDYVAPDSRPAVAPAEAVKPVEQPKLGPYAPRAPK